jgi:tetratricopeptide (TPR) repeat protein
MKAFADEKARACLEEAVGLAEELGAELELDDLLYSLGRLELAQSRNAQAARLFDRARELAARYNDAARGVLADAFLRRARRENAVHRAGEAPEPSLEEVGRRKPLAAALCYLRAREFLGSGHVGRAWETARRGLRWAEEVEDPSLLRHVAAEAARAAHAAGRPSEEVERILDVAHRATWVLLENYPRDVPREPFMEHPYNRALLEAWPDAIRAAPRR